jgi:outer membrane lipoprotein carrier protein
MSLPVVGKATRSALAAVVLIALAPLARADAVDTLREFARDVQTGSASFSQTVTSPDGARKKTSSGSFEFARPNRFRFAYSKPYEQLIVADGQKVWIYDADLNQASWRAMDRALGATPAALLAGSSHDKDFDLKALPATDGLEWASATPKAKDGTFQSLKVGFRGKTLAAIELVDSFGQRSTIQFNGLTTNPALAPELFRFVPPKGADVLAQ